jgi:hypothetical protein
LGLAENIDQETFDRYREAERKPQSIPHRNGTELLIANPSSSPVVLPQ